MSGWRWVKSRTMQHLHDEKGGVGVSMPLLTNKNYTPEARQEKTAALIEAAPDLLEAAKLACEVWPSHMRGSTLEQAILKAEGKL